MQTAKTKLGTVTDVRVDQERSRVYVDVTLTPNKFEEGVPYRMPGHGLWAVPEVGDTVELKKIKERYVALAPYNSVNSGLPDGLSEGDVAISLGETTFHLSQQDDETYDLAISVDGDVTIDGESIILGDGAASVPLCPYDHTHTAPDGGGDTSNPNESALNTEAE